MSVSVSEDGLVIDLVIDGLREGYVHDLEFPGLRSAAGNELSHERACYTLINRPDGLTMRIAMWSGPRNISTAMMRSWEHRADTAVDR